MILTLLRHALKLALHDAVEEWAVECGLPRKVVEKMRAQRLALAAQTEARQDARAAAALGVEDDEPEERLVLPLPSELHAIDPCPPPGDEAALLAWVNRQRGHRAGWSDLARMAREAGHAAAANTLRKRYRAWHDRADKGNDPSGPAA